MDDEELRSLFIGYGYEPVFVEGHEPDHAPSMAGALDSVLDSIRAIQSEARVRGPSRRPPAHGQ